MDLQNSSRISDFDSISEQEICFHYDPSFMAAVKDTQERAKRRRYAHCYDYPRADPGKPN